MVWISWGEQPKQGKGKKRTRERKKKQEVRFSTKIHSMGTRKWIWKTLYTLHLKHLFYGEGSEVEWVECNRLRRLSVKVQFKRVTVTKREKKKKAFFLRKVDTAIWKKKVLMLEMQNYYKMLRSKSFFFFFNRVFCEAATFSWRRSKVKMQMYRGTKKQGDRGSAML